MRFGHSFLYLGAACREKGVAFDVKHSLKIEDFAAHGGSIPIVVNGCGLVGAATVSGLAQTDDHDLVAAGIAHLQTDSLVEVC